MVCNITMQMGWDMDHPIKEHVTIIGDTVLHIYYFVSSDADDVRDWWMILSYEVPLL